MKYIFVAILAIASIGCKHNHKPPSAELQQAYKLQQEALKVNKSIDMLGKVVPSTITVRRDALLKNMVEIPGMDHDHANCNHDHSRQTISISDAEMLTVQQTWKDSMQVLYNEIKALK